MIEKSSSQTGTKNRHERRAIAVAVRAHYRANKKKRATELRARQAKLHAALMATAPARVAVNTAAGVRDRLLAVAADRGDPAGGSGPGDLAGTPVWNDGIEPEGPSADADLALDHVGAEADD